MTEQYVTMKGALQLNGDCPLENPKELRGVALRFAIESKVWMDFGKNEANAHNIVDIARVFETYIAGDNNA